MVENQYIEYKSTFNDSVIETLSAFANTKGGKVMVGITDEGKVNTGFSFGKESIQRWLNEIKVKTQPSIIPNIDIVTFENHDIIEFSIQEFPIKPVSFRGRYFKRVRNSNHQLSPVEIADMNLQSLQLSWDSYTASELSLNNLDMNKVNKFIQKVNSSGRFQLVGTIIENLEKLRLVSQNKITNAAYLLFSLEDIPYNVHLGRFKTEDIIIDDKMLRCSLFEAVEETMKYIVSQMKVAFEITGESLQRTEIFEYPLQAIRELVLNAFIHRDYLSSIDVQIKIFDQSISIFNPSGLFGNLTIDDLKTNNYRASTRNKLIAEAFYLTGDIEKYGSGFIRIRNAVAGYNTMKFDFKEIANGFLTELSYRIQKTSTKDGTKDGTKGYKEATMHRIIDVLIQNREITIDATAEILGIPRRTLVRYFEELKIQKKIRRIGSRRDGYWEVLE